jgi:hypothetical protein
LAKVIFRGSPWELGNSPQPHEQQIAATPCHTERVTDCSWRETNPGPHDEPEWRVTGMCVHEHLKRLLLCSACMTNLERTRRLNLTPPGPWCAHCYRMRPGGHHCTSVFEAAALEYAESD